ncbi:DUF5931 domain-containing protein [Nocardioides zeae]
MRPTVRFGEPLDFSRYEGMAGDRYILRSVTDEIMYAIMRLSEQEYVDVYASRAKADAKKAARTGDDEAPGKATARPPDVALRILPPGWRDAAAVAVENRMFRALALLRVVLLVNAVALNVVRRDNAQVAWALWTCVAAMVVWTGVALWGYAAPRRRRALLLLLDLAVAVALMLLTVPIKGDGFRASIPGFWIMGALLAWAVHWRWRGGAVAALVLIATDVSVRQELTQTNYGHLFLIGVGAPVVGYLCESLQRMAAERDRAEREAAAAAERARLARAVHDGVLQVLALTQRRGAELGPAGAELARLAGEQEGALRALIRQQDTLAPATAQGRSTWPARSRSSAGGPGPGSRS